VAYSPPLPSAAELQKSFDEGQYTGVIQSISQILWARHDGYEDYELWLLKAEALLHTKAPTEAARAFRQAAKVAPSEEQATAADAAGVLADRSPSGAFIPYANEPGPVPTPMEILSAEGRRAAEAALLGEMLDKERGELSAAAHAPNLLPTLGVMPVINDMRKLEVASSGGSDARLRAVAQAVYDHARDLIDDSVRQMAQSVEGIAQVANTVNIVDTYDDDGNFTGEYTYKTGLSSAAVGQLRSIFDIAARASSTARDLEASLDGVQGQGALTASATAAAQLATRANEVLNDNYN
jgi:hypothetical protein